MSDYRVLDIASIFVQLANSLPNHHIDNLKLNKLCYYAQGWHIARLREPLFREEIQAWEYGPLIPEVYYTYRVCGGDPIKEPATEFDEDNLTREDASLITDVYIHYGKYTSAALIDLTHQPGTPWNQVYEPRKNKIIGVDLIRDYFMNDDKAQGTEYNFSPELIANGISEE